MKFLSFPTYILIIALTLFSACGSDNNAENKANETSTDKNLMELTSIPEFIEAYYHKDYSQYIKDENNSFNNLSISYKGRLDESDSMMQWLITIDIPKLNAESGIFRGDLNHDKAKDLIIMVHTEGGGGNIASDEFFTFTNKNNKYLFNSVTTSAELSGCPDNYGYFGAKEIRDNILFGKSSCYAEEDGRCCPSLKYKTEVILKGKKLTYNSKVATVGSEDL